MAHTTNDHLITHTAEHHNKGTKWIWNIFWLLLLITVIEITIGLLFKSKDISSTAMMWRNIVYMTLTFVKAGYILYSYMHLKDETKFLQRIIVWPMLFLVYAIVIFLMEGDRLLTFANDVWK